MMGLKLSASFWPQTPLFLGGAGVQPALTVGITSDAAVSVPCWCFEWHPHLNACESPRALPKLIASPTPPPGRLLLSHEDILVRCCLEGNGSKLSSPPEREAPGVGCAGQGRRSEAPCCSWTSSGTQAPPGGLVLHSPGGLVPVAAPAPSLLTRTCQVSRMRGEGERRKWRTAGGRAHSREDGSPRSPGSGHSLDTDVSGSKRGSRQPGLRVVASGAHARK